MPEDNPRPPRRPFSWGPDPRVKEAAERRKNRINGTISERLGISVEQVIQRRKDLANLPYKVHARKLGMSVKEFVNWCGLMHWRDNDKDYNEAGLPLNDNYWKESPIPEEEAARKLGIFTEELGYFCDEVDLRSTREWMRWQIRKEYWKKYVWRDLWKWLTSDPVLLFHQKLNTGEVTCFFGLHPWEEEPSGLEPMKKRGFGLSDLRWLVHPIAVMFAGDFIIQKATQKCLSCGKERKVYRKGFVVFGPLSMSGKGTRWKQLSKSREAYIDSLPKVHLR